MSDTKASTEDFVSNIQKGDIRSAIASVMGQRPEGIRRSKRLLIEFSNQDLENKKSILEWAHKPWDKLPISDQRWFVEEIARHEMAHIVTAKALGFATGEATLVLYSPDGSHRGTSEIHLEFQISSLSDVSNYVERRIIILLAGYLAEPVNVSERNKVLRNICSMRSTESDLQKALELICMKLNIEGVTYSGAITKELHKLAKRALAIVEANFEIISALAQRFSNRIEFYEQCVGWEGSEIDEQPEIRHIVKI